MNNFWKRINKNYNNRLFVFCFSRYTFFPTVYNNVMSFLFHFNGWTQNSGRVIHFYLSLFYFFCIFLYPIWCSFVRLNHIQWITKITISSLQNFLLFFFHNEINFKLFLFRFFSFFHYAFSIWLIVNMFDNVLIIYFSSSKIKINTKRIHWSIFLLNSNFKA